MRCWSRLKAVVVCLTLTLLLGVEFAFAAEDLPNNPPSDPPFFGGYYISGYDPLLGNCTIYIPVGEGWCLDKYGFLFHYGSGSVTGLIIDEDGTEYTFNAQTYATPRYRPVSGSSYSYIDLSFNPSASNVVVENSFVTAFDRNYVLDLALFAAAGLILVVLVSRGR